MHNPGQLDIRQGYKILGFIGFIWLKLKKNVKVLYRDNVLLIGGWHKSVVIYTRIIQIVKATALVQTLVIKI